MTKERTQQYIADSARTAPEGATYSDNMIHAALGMATEELEVIEAIDSHGVGSPQWFEECGDWAWYAALMVRALRDDEVMALPWSGQQYRTTEEICSAVKAWLFYGREINRPQLLVVLLRMIDSIHDIALAANIEKLKKRYPEKFDVVSANARDLDAEAIAIAEAVSGPQQPEGIEEQMGHA